MLTSEKYLKAVTFAKKGPRYHRHYLSWRVKRFLERRHFIYFDRPDAGFLDRINISCSASQHSKHAEAFNGQTPESLDRYFKQKNDPAFFFDDGELEHLVESIPRSLKDETIKKADDICQNTFRFRSHASEQFSEEIDWFYRPGGNIDWTWDLNRHIYLEDLGRAFAYTNDEKYAAQFKSIISSWLHSNPLNVRQPNWQSVFEVSIRINSWIWAFFLFRHSSAFGHPAFGFHFLQGLYWHGDYLFRYLERHAQNNHLLLEAKALAFLGFVFHEFDKADDWFREGTAILYEQFRRQVHSDGVYGEMSTHYHRLVSGEVMELLVLLVNNGVRVPDDILEIHRAMVEFEVNFTKPDGTIPMIGDSHLEDPHLRFSGWKGGMALYGYRPAWEQLDPRDEATRWLLGGEKAKALLEDTPYEPGELLRSKAFPDGGYYVMRGHDAGEGAYLIFDCGPFGFEQSPVHAHSDALAFELACHGTTVMMDPGSYSTKLETTWRNFFRGTAAHNTVTIDGQDQTILFERNRSNRPARCRTHRWCSGNDFDFVDGSHDGYLRLSDPVRHRRQIFYLKGQYWVVGDFIDGSGSHACDINFHFTEDSTLHVSETDASVRVDKPGFPAFNIFPYSRADFTSTVIAGEIEPIQGWISYYSGSKLPAPVLQYRICGSAPLEFFSILLPHREPGYELSGICEVPVTVDQSVRSQKNNIAAISFKLDKFVDILISDRNETPIDKQFLGFSTDAAVAYLRCDSRRRIAYRAATVGGRYIRFGDTDLPGSMMCHPDFLFEQH